MFTFFLRAKIMYIPCNLIANIHPKAMNTEEIENMLLSKGVKPTSNRILVVRELIRASHPISLTDLEIALNTIDKSSIFRVLELLADKDVIHAIEDGSRSKKYEICHGRDHHSIADQHVHFYCENCKETFCLEDIAVPSIETPPGYEVTSVNFILKGICPSCARSHKEKMSS